MHCASTTRSSHHAHSLWPPECTAPHHRRSAALVPSAMPLGSSVCPCVPGAANNGGQCRRQCRASIRTLIGDMVAISRYQTNATPATAYKKGQIRKRYEKNKKAHNQGVKCKASLLPAKRDAPALSGTEFTVDPDVGHVEAYFQKQLSRATPEKLPKAPWTDTDNPGQLHHLP